MHGQHKTTCSPRGLDRPCGVCPAYAVLINLSLAGKLLLCRILPMSDCTQILINILRHYYCLFAIMYRCMPAESLQESEGRPPILFIHGSYHGAWCYAVSLEGPVILPWGLVLCGKPWGPCDPTMGLGAMR